MTFESFDVDVRFTSTEQVAILQNTSPNDLALEHLVNGNNRRTAPVFVILVPEHQLQDLGWDPSIDLADGVTDWI
jgi:hypothetical protein